LRDAAEDAAGGPKKRADKTALFGYGAISTIAAGAALVATTLVSTAGLAAFAAGFACFLRGELMGIATFMRCLAAFAGNLALAVLVHGCETTVGGITLVAPLVSTLVSALVTTLII
jgi:hypothetical protein